MHKNPSIKDSQELDSALLARNLHADRLLSLIEFAQHTARLKSHLVSEVERHKLFNKFEHELIGLPGIRVDMESEQEEVWLSIKRLQETHPPSPVHEYLNAWLDVSRNPAKEPVLKTFVISDSPDNHDIIKKSAEERIFLSDCKDQDSIQKYFEEYVEHQWKVWATEEKLRRRTIKLYGELFTLKQQLEGAITDAQIELVWGQGIGLWKINNGTIRYPLLTQQLEIVLKEDMSIEIRPKRAVGTMAELDAFTDIESLGVTDLKKAYDDILENQQVAFSPFDRTSYEPYLRLAVMHLDPKGVYWPEYTIENERSIPPVSDDLRITDTWILFARPRSKSLFIQDLENFKKQLNNDSATCTTSSVIKEFISEPLTEHRQAEFPNFRGLSSNGYGDLSSGAVMQELFFPLPFNDEQVEIVKKLEYFKGVVVQGPPGTGKTHTIANIIAHYMANGKRVLVTSMKEPALFVLKEKLPESIQSLAIALLTNEQNGMKQFEFAVSKIVQELHVTSPYILEREIQSLEQYVDQLHARLASLDRSICNWAKNNIDPIHVDGETILPEDAARSIAAAQGEFDWFDDNILITNDNKLLFDNTDIICLRQARTHLQNDIDYFDKNIPNADQLPEINQILSIHQEIIKNKVLKELVQSKNILNISNLSENINTIKALINILYEFQTIRAQLSSQNESWCLILEDVLKAHNSMGISETIEALFIEIDNVYLEENSFLTRPVALPDDLLLTDDVIQAICNRAQGKRAFGFSEKVTKRTLVSKINAICILNRPAKSIEEWNHIHRHALLYLKKSELVLRWNKIVDEMSIFSRLDAGVSSSLRQARKEIPLYFLVKSKLQRQGDFKESLIMLLGHVPKANDFFESETSINELINFLENNIDYHQSEEYLFKKEAVLNGLARYTGRISESIKTFVSDTVGNSTVSEQVIKTQWASLIDELQRVSNLRPYLDDLIAVSDLIDQSGGINWAKKLRSEGLISSVDYLLPSDWQKIWRLRRLSNYLKAGSQFEEFKKLTIERYAIEKQMASTYQGIIAKRTWLKLSNNATPNIRAALQAFCSAIAKIGKGTGKRAARYRQDAKNSAALISGTIPCWIMSHDRVSESLPVEFGGFDLVIIDEASQSDLSALPAILRANKLLIVGDDKQVSPEGIGIEEEKIKALMRQFLTNQVDLYRQAISPERSIYDLCKIVFSDSQIMLREHFRSVAPIIEYSKREFYNHELKPLRLPKRSERLDPPLIDVLVEDGSRNNKINMCEAIFIVEEIKKICADPQMVNKTIGVVSLLGNEQAKKIWEMLREIPEEKSIQHQITCGDALTFQGKERDIMFLSMVVTKDNNKAESRESSAQRFNVAASRARDRMYLVRSVELEDLSAKDRLRQSLIKHFSSPFMQDEERTKNLRDLCESPFEQEMYDLLVERGYRVIPQVKVGNFRIDMVVEGHNDARLAIECDGDRYHDASRWENDMNRQRILERAGWKFWRCFASTFVMNRDAVVLDLLQTLNEQNIEAIGSEGVIHSIHCEHRKVTSLAKPFIMNPILEEEAFYTGN